MDYSAQMERMEEFVAATGRVCSVAHHTDLTPDTPALTSRLLGDGILRDGEAWPRRDGRCLTPVLQVRTDELHAVPEPLAGAAWFSVWMDVDAFDLGQLKQGDGWRLVTYPSLDGLVARQSPAPAERPEEQDWRAFAISWERHVDILDQRSEAVAALPPEWRHVVEETSWGAYTHKPRGQGDRTSRRTKIGGFPTYKQWEDGPSHPAHFLFQIAPDLHGYDLCDMAYSYVGLIDGEWVLETQTS